MIQYLQISLITITECLLISLMNKTDFPQSLINN